MSLPNEQNIREWLADELNEGPSAVTVYAVDLNRRYSRIFKAVAPALPHPVAVKVCLDPDTSLPSRSSAADQMDALNKAVNSAGPPCRLPRAYKLLVERGCLVTEWIDGQPLDKLWRFRKRPSEIVAECKKAATWLRNLHQRGYVGHEQFDASGWLRRLSKDIGDASPEFKELPIVRGALSLLFDSQKAVSSDRLAVSWIHGDFKPGNIVIWGRDVTGLDLHLRHKEVVLRDISSFLLELHLMAMEPGHITLLPIERPLEDAFLVEYFEGKPPFAAQWAKLHLALSTWTGRKRGTGYDLRKAFLNARLKRVVSRVSDQIRADL